MNWTGIVIHHSLSHDVSAEEIDRWHKKRGWRGIGYHCVIRKNGKIEPGRNITQQGAHAKGRNHTHIGICLTGNFEREKPPEKQINSLIKVITILKMVYDIQKIERHHERCPGKLFPFKQVLKKVGE